MKHFTILAAAAALAWTTPALADSHGGHKKTEMKMDGVQVEAVWARASVGANGAAYAKLVNHGKSADRLIAVRAGVANRAELHTHVMDDNVMRMRRVAVGIALPPGKSVTMKPGGYHIMLFDLKRKLVAGDRFSITFVFEKAGDVPIMATIGKMGAMGPGMNHGHGKMKH